MITNKPISLIDKGTIQKILKASYQNFFIYFPQEKNVLYEQWEQEDEEAFNNQIIGNHTMFSCINDHVIGYFSWDDRNFPCGMIGQNCIIQNIKIKVMEKSRYHPQRGLVSV